MQHSIAIPARCEISTTGVMSPSVVRAAQLGRMRSFAATISLREALDVAHHVRSGARQSDVHRIDVERLHQVEDAQLLIDRRGADARRLQAVAQRLVVEHHRPGRIRRRVDRVPVVNQRVHVTSFTLS